MEKTTSAPKKLSALIPKAVRFFFYGSVLWIVASTELPPIKEPVFLLRKLLFQGEETVFRVQDPGLPFAIFKGYRPQSRHVSFFTDTPYDPRLEQSEQLRAAQGELAPVLLDPVPGAKTAFVFCSNAAVAEKRVKEEGYRMVQILGNGKGIAEKLP